MTDEASPRISRRGRRWMIAIGIVLAALIALGVTAELVVRSRFADRLEGAAPEGATIELAGSVVWGFVTGAIPVRVTIDDVSLRERVETRTGGVVDDLWIDDGIHLSTVYNSPIGELPVDVVVVPEIVDGTITTDIASVTVDGVAIEIPATDALPLPDVLADGFDGSCVEASSVTADDGVLTLQGNIPLRRGGGDGCAAVTFGPR